MKSVFLKTTRQNCVMESGDHFKNGARLESDTIGDIFHKLNRRDYLIINIKHKQNGRIQKFIT